MTPSKLDTCILVCLCSRGSQCLSWTGWTQQFFSMPSPALSQKAGWHLKPCFPHLQHLYRSALVVSGLSFLYVTCVWGPSRVHSDTFCVNSYAWKHGMPWFLLQSMPRPLELVFRRLLSFTLLELESMIFIRTITVTLKMQLLISLLSLVW
jgi:hypothetical protein